VGDNLDRKKESQLPSKERTGKKAHPLILASRDDPVPLSEVHQPGDGRLVTGTDVLARRGLGGALASPEEDPARANEENQR
jgi:hypothetical protein